MSKRRSYVEEGGNILFLILLAVVLFAALSYAVTSSLRGGGSDASKESAQVQAATIIQYAAQLEQSIQRLRLIKNCADTQISFQYDQNGDGVINASDTNYKNDLAPSDYRCHLFHPNGAGVAQIVPPAAFANSQLFLFTAGDFVRNIGTSCSAVNCTELVIQLNEIRDDLCQAINKKVTGTITIPTEEDGSISNNHSVHQFIGSYTRTEEIGGTGIDGYPMLCIKVGANNVFYSVLLAR